MTSTPKDSDAMALDALLKIKNRDTVFTAEMGLTFLKKHGDTLEAALAPKSTPPPAAVIDTFDDLFAGFGDFESEAYSRGVSIDDGDIEKLRLFYDYIASRFPQIVGRECA